MLSDKKINKCRKESCFNAATDWIDAIGEFCKQCSNELICIIDNFITVDIQPERSKREDSDCCKELEKIERLRDVIIRDNISCGEWYSDYSDVVDIFNDLCKQAEMRCSEHERKPREG